MAPTLTGDITGQALVHSLTDDLLKLVLQRVLPVQGVASDPTGSARPPGLVVSPSALQLRQDFVKHALRSGLPFLRREDRAESAAWRDSLASIDLAAGPDLRDQPVWDSGAAAERLYSAARGIPPLPALCVCKKWRRILLQRCVGEVVVCGAGEPVPQSTKVLVLLSAWPTEDDDNDWETQLADIPDLPALKTVILVHISGLEIKYDDSEGKVPLVLPALPSNMNHLEHLVYVNTERHTQTFTASSYLYPDTVARIIALTKLQTLHLPDVNFGGDSAESASVTQWLLEDLPKGRLKALYLGQVLVANLDACAAFTALTTLYITALCTVATAGSTENEKNAVDVSPLSQLSALATLSLHPSGGQYLCDVTDADTLTQLRRLELDCFGPAKDTAAQFAALSSLDSLEITTASLEVIVEDTMNDERMVEGLGTVTALPRLALNVSSLGDFAPIVALTSLQSLSVCMVPPDGLPHGAQIEPSNIDALSTLTSLTSLTVIKCVLDAFGSCALMYLANLVQLRLCDCPLLIPGVLQAMTALRDLRLERLCFGFSNDPDGSLASMQLARTCRGLTALELPHLVCESAERVAELARLSALEHLDLGRTEVTDEGVRKLRVLTSLRALHLNGSRRITAAGLRHLTSCRSLQCLTVRGCGISARAPEAVALSRQGVLIDYGRQETD